MGERVASVLTSPAPWVAGLILAAAGALFWVLRGALAGPAAEAAAEAPPAGYRDRVAAATVGGLLLVLIAAFVAVGFGVIWSLPLFAAGFGLLILLVRANRKFRHASPSLRRVVTVADAALNGALLAGVLIVGNVLAFRYGGRPLDLTRERAFSLSSLTLNQLHSLDRPVTFTAFFGRGAAPRRERLLELLEQYQTEAPGKITIEVLNPFEDFAKFEALKKLAPDVAVTPGGVLVTYGEGSTAARAVVRESELFEFTPLDPTNPAPDRLVSQFRGEDALTSALMRLREGKKPRVAVIIGHGEPSAHVLDPNQPGLGLLRSRLESIGADPFVHNLARDELPADTDLAIIAGPTTPFQAAEVARLSSYMERGGHALLIVGNSEPTGLDNWLRGYNVAIEPGVVFDPVYNVGGRPSLILAPILGVIRHPIVDPLINRSAIVPNAAPLKALTNPAAVPGGQATPILLSSPESWAETDLTTPRPQLNRDKDTPGPIPVGIAVTESRRPGSTEPPRPLLVVFSSPYLADNRFLAIAGDPTNLDLLMNAVAWLRGRPEQLGIAPKTHVALRLLADRGLRDRLVLVPTVMALAVIIGFGLATYFARRA